MKRSLGCIFNRSQDISETAGLRKSGLNFTLDTIYRQPHAFMIYYGELQYSGFDDYSCYDVMVSSDQNAEQVAKARACGTKIFQYYFYGSRFRPGGFIEEMKSNIENIASNNLGDGIFFDECEPGYWSNECYSNPEMMKQFDDGLKELCDYCYSLGLECICNGVDYYSNYGTYFLWESFAGYWSTDQIIWDGGENSRISRNENGTTYYSYNFSKWKFSGSVHVTDGKVVDGTDGTMTIDLDLKQLIPKDKQTDTFPWVYFEWFGEGADDESLEIYASVGNEWPYNEKTWTRLPKLWKGEPASWNGINMESRFIRLELHFKGASNLRMDNCILCFNYVYPYYDMTQPNPDADQEHHYWNFNLTKARYLWDKKSRVLCHCYGLPDDKTRMEYSWAVFKTFGYEAWDYTHPLHQIIHYTDILDDPFGAFLSRTDEGNGKFHGVFTGCETEIDTKNNTYQIKRNEPSYWYDRGCDSFTDEMCVYSNPDPYTLGTFELTSEELSENTDVDALASQNGWLVTQTYGPDYMYDENNQIIREMDGEPVTYTKTVSYYQKMPADLNIRKCYMFDDIYYFYFAFRFEGAVDFLKTNPNRYYVYLGSDEVPYGFVGEWYRTPFKAQFMIYNESLFKWNKTDWEGKPSNESDYTNFKYIGNAFLEYSLLEDGHLLVYKLKKSVLGTASQKNMKFYFTFEDTVTDNAALIPREGLNTDIDPVAFTGRIKYSQRRFNLYAPHGYLKSEEIEFRNPASGLLMSVTADVPDGTWVDLFVRYRKAGESEFSDFQKVDGLFFYTDVEIDRLQYAVGLNTTDGETTPVVRGVFLDPGAEIIPKKDTNRRAKGLISFVHVVSYKYGGDV